MTTDQEVRVQVRMCAVSVSQQPIAWFFLFNRDEWLSSEGAAKSGGASGDVGLEVVYKAVSEKTASMLYNCIKQRLDRSAAVAALEQQERTRTANQELWVNHLNQCCDDVFDDVVGSSAGKSVLEAEVCVQKHTLEFIVATCLPTVEN